MLCFSLVVLVAGFSLLQEEQEASGQLATLPAPAEIPLPREPATATATLTAPAEDLPLASRDEEPLPEQISPTIPTLSLMDVLGNLKYLPHTEEFACTSGPTEGPETFWTCWSPGSGSPVTRVVTVLGDDPGSISSVTVTASGLDEEEAAAFFVYVLDLCLAGNDPTNTRAWVRQDISSGGIMFARSADLSLYGTKEERTLEIVAPGFGF